MLESRSTASSHPDEKTPTSETLHSLQPQAANALTGVPEAAYGINLPSLSHLRQTGTASPERHAPATVHDAVEELVRKLFIAKNGCADRLLYRKELSEIAAKSEITPEGLIEAALEELHDPKARVSLTREGKVTDSKRVGPHFESVMSIIEENVDARIIGKEQLLPGTTSLSASYRREFAKIVEAGEYAILVLVKTPPQEAVEELRAIAEQKLDGLMLLLRNPMVQEQLEMSSALRNYLRYATVRVLCTGRQQAVTRIAEAINTSFERSGEFEDAHWRGVIKGITVNEKAESLKEAFKVCIPVVAAIKGLEHFFPAGLHLFGGLLDDLFGGIVPDVSQSLGAKGGTFVQRWKKAWGVMKAGLVSLPLAVGFGWGSAALYHATSSAAMHGLAGVMFAMACCVGTFGTSVAAFRKSQKSIDNFCRREEFRSATASWTWRDKMKFAFQDSIIDVPFRIGHTLVGVPFQIGLGAAAGVFGFFNNASFVMVEGMAETILGALAVVSYGAIHNYFQSRRLRGAAFSNAA